MSKTVSIKNILKDNFYASCDDCGFLVDSTYLHRQNRKLINWFCEIVQKKKVKNNLETQIEIATAVKKGKDFENILLAPHLWCRQLSGSL